MENEWEEFHEWKEEYEEAQELYNEYEGKDEEELKWELVYTHKLLKEICKLYDIDLAEALHRLLVENSMKLERMYHVEKDWGKMNE